MEYTPRVTTNHSTIKQWAENRGGIPVRIRQDGSTPGLGDIKIYFPDTEEKGENWEELPWNEFLEQFENQKLAMEYKENDANGDVSLYYQMLDRQMPGNQKK